MVHMNDWNYASNIVAKRYFDDDVLPKTYFDDIKLQMDAKLWAEEYNRHGPPKKVIRETQWAKSPKIQSEGVHFAILSKIHSYRLLFLRFSPMGSIFSCMSVP